MTSDELAKFKIDFRHLTDNSPFPWQESLFARFVGEAPGGIPASCKTAVIAVWLLALMRRPEIIPRRLVYVVNRRTVVDQTTHEVENLRNKLPLLTDRPHHVQNLAISTLRGQFADHREWSALVPESIKICI